MKPETGHPFADLSDPSREEINRIVERDRLYRRIREELYCNSRYDRFFSHFEEQSVHDFIAYYAGRKADYLLNGEKHLREAESAQLYFRHLAEKYFWEIQQKKLFDLQCRWRAGEAELPGIEVTRDFLVEEFNICSSSHVAPVTPAELHIYTDYLQSDMYTPESHHDRWQDYDYFSTAWRAGESAFPKWYVFYDEAIGRADLFSLPDLKGDKERRYLSHATQNDGRETPEIENLPAPIERPELKPDFRTMEFFVSTFEDKTLSRYFVAMENDSRDGERKRLEEALHILQLSDSPVAVPESSDWRRAIIAAADAFRRESLVTSMKEVYAEYRLRLEAGLGFVEDADAALVDMLRARVTKYKEAILHGRRTLGEPANYRY